MLQLPKEPVELAEPQRLLDAFVKLIANVVEAYVELSGQTAATQAVVADLRRCGSSLQSRLVGEPPPAPWLSVPTRGASSSITSPAATPAAPRASTNKESTVDHASTALGGSAIPGGIRSPPPSLTSPQAASGGAPSPAEATAAAGELEPWVQGNPGPHTPSPTAATAIASSSGRPPFAGAGPGATGRAGSVGRTRAASRPPAVAMRNFGNISAAGRPSGTDAVGRICDMSPQRRGRGGHGMAAGPAVTLRSATPGGTSNLQACRASSPSQAGEGLAQAGSSAVGKGHATGTSGVVCVAAEASSSTRDGGHGAYAHLPLAAQRAMAAAEALAGVTGAQGVQDSHFPDRQQQQKHDGGGHKVVGPPQLPLALRRAMQRYRDTLQTRDQLLQQYQQRRGASGTNSSSGTGCDPSLADSVAAAGRSYRSALGRQYPSNGTGYQVAVGGSSGARTLQSIPHVSRISSGSASASTCVVQHTAELRRRAQVVFAALVAAQTWLVQSLSELTRFRGSPGGVAVTNRRVAQADTCTALLADVELLRIELGDLQAQIEARTEAPPQTVSPPPAATALGPAGAGAYWPSGSNSSPDSMASVAAGLGCDREQLEEAAVLWRNRFLRTLLCDSAGPGARRGQGSLGAPQKLSPLPPQPHQPDLDGLRAGDVGPCMRRPLGFWLPDALWPHIPLPGDETVAAAASTGPASSASAVAPQSPAGLNGARLAASGVQRPWHVLLPASTQTNATVALVLAPESGASTRRGASAPLALLCTSVQDAVAHGRAQLQLQATMFQWLLESWLAAPLLPRQRPPQPQIALAQVTGGRSWLQDQQKDRAALIAWERWLAQCRLAHLLLFKGAWNRLCSVVEREDEEPVRSAEDGERL